MLSAHNKHNTGARAIPSPNVRLRIAWVRNEGKPARRREGCPEAAPSLPMSVSQLEIAYRPAPAADRNPYFTFPPRACASSLRRPGRFHHSLSSRTAFQRPSHFFLSLFTHHPLSRRRREFSPRVWGGGNARARGTVLYCKSIYRGHSEDGVGTREGGL